MSEAPQRPRTRDEFLAEFMQLGKCIDDLLVGHHGLRAALKPGHPAWDTALPDAMRVLGTGPVFHLWNECRLVEALRVAWTGQASPVAAMIPQPAPVPPVQTPDK
jgi:hypothetical protein